MAIKETVAANDRALVQLRGPDGAVKETRGDNPVHSVAHEEIIARGIATIQLFGADGTLKETRVANTVTTAGKAGIADQLLASPSLNKPTHMAIGTGTPSGTALGTELDRNALTSKTRSGAVVTMVGTWAAGDGTGAITEAGIFDASSAGNMYCSTTFSVINKGSSDTLTVTWALTIA